MLIVVHALMQDFASVVAEWKTRFYALLWGIKEFPSGFF
jgi:hypothetical protein